MKILTWISTLFFVGFAGYMIWIVDKKDLSTTQEPDKVEQPMIMKEIVLRDYDKERIKWKIKAEKMLLYEQQKVSYLSQINGEIFHQGDRKTPPDLLIADKAKVENSSNLITLTGNIDFKLSTGDSIQTEHLIIDSDKDRIFNNTRTFFFLGENQVRSESMHYNLKTERLILSKVTLQIENF